VAVLLDADPYDVGEWLADAAAFEAAGVDELWLRYDDESPLDPCTLCAALAAVTHRARLVLHPAGDASPRTLESLDRLGRRQVRGGRRRRGQAVVHHPVPVQPGGVAGGARRRDRARRARRLVAGRARLLDILRNPDEPGERHDLQLTVG
jgi:hypothetical protein